MIKGKYSDEEGALLLSPVDVDEARSVVDVRRADTSFTTLNKQIL
jgi:hypothetical protein